MGSVGKPVADVDCTPALLRSLLAEQAPDLLELPITNVGAGWDNAMFRLGDELVARLPRRELGSHLILHEQRWLPEIAPLLPLPVPVPVVFGKPSGGYPWHWSISNWIEGERALGEIGTRWMAGPIGDFLAHMHRPAPAEAPHNPYRGVPLWEREERQQQWFNELRGELDPKLHGLWTDLLETPPWEGVDVWMHGDMHPLNVLVRPPEVAGVIDFGDITSGDPASDLVIGWMLFDQEGRREFADATAGYDDATWQRSRAWAVVLGTAFRMHSHDDPAMRRVADHALEQALLG